MINLVIWSKDRACQLDLLLRSIAQYADVFLARTFYPQIIYKATTPEYQRGYDICRETHLSCEFIPEKDFMTDTVKAVDTNMHFTAFSTDDMVFYSRCPSPNGVPLRENEVFSFRLGYNTIIQNCHTGELQPPLFNPGESEYNLEWNPKDYPLFTNYAYPLALDLHVFKTSYLLRLLNKIGHFKTSNELESKMQNYVYDIDVIRSYKQSVAFNIPCNNMSTVTKHGEKFPYSLKYLNDNYLNGERLDLMAISKNNILGCHQEVELLWEKR